MNSKILVIRKLPIIFSCVILIFFVSIVSMEMRIQLDGGTLCVFTPYQVASSALLLEKQALRAKTKPEDILRWSREATVKWSYDESLYMQLQDAPFHVHKVDMQEVGLFKEALDIKPEEFALHVSKLTFEQMNMLYNVSKTLKVPQLITQLAECCLSVEVLQTHIEPHFLTKKIADHLRDQTIIHNATQEFFIQKEEKLSGDDVEVLFNPTFSSFMMVPTCLIKNNKYAFNGVVGRVTTTLNDQVWTRLIEQKRDENIKYILTPDITDEECAQQEIKRFSRNKRILWTVDATTQNVIHKKNIACGGTLEEIRFSPNGHYVATASHKTDSCPDNTCTLTQLGTSADGSDYHDIISFNPEREITFLFFNPQSTLLVATSYGKEEEKTVFLYDTLSGTQLVGLSGHNGVVNLVQFNHSGTQMLSASYCSTYFGKVLQIFIWDVTDRKNIKLVEKHHLISPGVVAKCEFSSDDTQIILTLSDGDLILLYGSYRMDRCPGNTLTASVCSPQGRFLASTLLGKTIEHTNNTHLYDVRNGSLLAAIVKNQFNTCGVGFTPDGRCIVNVGSTGQLDGHSTITTELYDMETQEALECLKKENLFVQYYALYRMYCARQEDELTKNSAKQFLLNIMHNKIKQYKGLKALFDRF